MIDWRPIGRHLLSVDGDIVHIIWHGEVRLVDVEQVFAIYAEVHDQQGRAFSLANMKDSDLPSMAVRKWITDWIKRHRKLDAAAAYGANMLIRAAFILLTRAASLVSKQHLPSGVFATEAEARDWLTELRGQR